MMGQRFESGFGGSTGRSRSACDSQTPTSLVGAHSRTAVDPSDPALHPLAVVCHVFSGLCRDVFIVREPHTNATENFPLELRAKTPKVKLAWALPNFRNVGWATCCPCGFFAPSW